MGRAVHRRKHGRPGQAIRTLVLSVVAFACGMILLRTAAGLWAKHVVAAALKAGNDSRYQIADWKAVEPPRWNLNGYSNGFTYNRN